MEMDCRSHEPNLASSNQIVKKIPGEPAVVINGLPDVNPVLDSSSQLDLVNVNDFDLKSDHQFGEWMEGREVKKIFGDRFYAGKIVKYDREMNWYKVVYEDGDFEDLDWHELEQVLVAIDVSYPLKKLALGMIKNDKCNEYKENSSKKNSNKRRQQDRYENGPKRKLKQPKGTSKLKEYRKKNLNRRGV